jgi:hypothetical protein
MVSKYTSVDAGEKGEFMPGYRKEAARRRKAIPHHEFLIKLNDLRLNAGRVQETD